MTQWLESQPCNLWVMGSSPAFAGNVFLFFLLSLDVENCDFQSRKTNRVLS